MRWRHVFTFAVFANIPLVMIAPAKPHEPSFIIRYGLMFVLLVLAIIQEVKTYKAEKRAQQLTSV